MYLFAQVHRLPDFTPCLLQIVMNNGVPLPSRQAGRPHDMYYTICVGGRKTANSSGTAISLVSPAS